MSPASHRRAASPTRLATVLVLLVILGGLWLARQQATPPVVSAPSSVDAPASPTATPTPAPPTSTAQSGGASAARDAAAASTVERYDLEADEAKGGHTLARHVGRTDVQLRERLERERISAASTYTTRAVAERTVARTLSRHAARVASWLARRGNRPNLALDYRGPRSEILGRSFRRGRRDALECSDAVVVLRWDGARGYYVLTSYPEAAR